jgi:hypothetical protein
LHCASACLRNDLEHCANRRGDLAAAQRGDAVDLLRVAGAHDDLVADQQVGDEVRDLQSLRVDIHAADDDIDAFAEQRRDQALELDRQDG